MKHKAFVVASSRIGPAVHVSGEKVRKVVRELEALGAIEVERTPTGRSHLTVEGYERVRDAIHGTAATAA